MTAPPDALFKALCSPLLIVLVHRAATGRLVQPVVP
jgi:hypothetical protein